MTPERFQQLRQTARRNIERRRQQEALRLLRRLARRAHGVDQAAAEGRVPARSWRDLRGACDASFAFLARVKR